MQATQAIGGVRRWRGFDPLRTVHRLLTSVRVALLLLAAVAVGALLGVIFPQAPDEVRAVPASYDAFTQFQHGRYGLFTAAMRRLGFFEVFHTWWFNGLIVILLLAVAVCTANRIPPIVRNVRRPLRRVNDRYFLTARHRAEFTTPADPSALVGALRRSRYHVEQTERDGATYLFADRFSWAQYGTFLSHLALILFMSGAIVTKVVGFSTDLTISEGNTEPVFPVVHSGQMQVQNLRAGDTPDAAGNPTRYFSNLAVYRDGRRICTGTTTVNGPMHCAGYTFHQTTFSNVGVALQVRDASTGQLLYNEVPDLAQGGSAPSPHLRVQDRDGNVLFDDTVVLVPVDPTLRKLAELLPIQRADGSVLPLLVVAAQEARGQWVIELFHPKGDQAEDESFALALLPGHIASAGEYLFSVSTLGAIPLAAVTGIPGMEGAALLQLGTTAKGERQLDLLDMGGSPEQASSNAGAGSPAGRLDLAPGVPQVLNGYQYTFLGVRSITGITVRRDPGATIIWVATALLLLGLLITFYVPRRRLWAKVTAERTYLAGVADGLVNFSAEMHRLGVKAGSPDAEGDGEE